MLAASSPPPLRHAGLGGRQFVSPARGSIAPPRTAAVPRASSWPEQPSSPADVLHCIHDGNAEGRSSGEGTTRTSLSRRDALASGLGILAVGAAATSPPEASAGAVLNGLLDMLADAEAAVEADPENEQLLGQRTFFENQVERVQLNASFVDRLRPRVAAGDTAYLQRAVLTVDEALFDDEVYFWKNAMGMRVTREVKRPDGGKSVVLAFGQETLDADDGGKAAVELRQGPSGTRALGNGLAYVSLTVPYGVRVSRIYEAGGELVYGFGYFDVRSPSGYAVRAQVAARRDPVELVALNVPNVREAEKYYAETFGMTGRPPLDTNAYAPKSPPGSRLMTFGEPKETMGVLLQPLAAAVDDASSGLDVGEVFQGLVFVVGGQPGDVATPRSADAAGFGVETESYEAWEAAVKEGAARLPAEYNAPPPV